VERSKIVKAQYQGREVEVDEVEVLLSKEQWSEYQLADGKMLMLKTVLVGVQRIVGETAPDGAPLYQLQTHIVPRVK
jgi:hypothetical protein